MKKEIFLKRFIYPVLTVFIIMTVSFFCYFGTKNMDNYTAHQIIAFISGTLYFISVALGTLYVFAVSYVRGASLWERVLASAINPFIWMTKEVLIFTESHPLRECLYYYLNPLNIWLVSFMIFEMGLAGIIARKIIKNRGENIRVFTLSALAAMALGLGFAIVAYAWGQGENIYVLFLEGYRHLFGTGIGGL